VPSLEQVQHVIRNMPAHTEIERRDRAVVAFVLLTGTRDGAIPSLRLKHVDLAEGRVMFDAREVRTKFSKFFPTWFFPVGDEIRAIVAEYVERLRREALCGPDDPLFPATLVRPGPDRLFQSVGLARAAWSNATPIRSIFKKAFASVGLPCFPPHSFRKTLAQLGERLCQTPEAFKAWSQNLGHEGVLTTFGSYGEVSTARQSQIIRGLAHASVPSPEAMQHLQRAAEALARNSSMGGL
jgi:integrase